MRIRRIVIRNLRAVHERDDSFELTPGHGVVDVSPAVCFHGGGGAGKTTCLDVMAALWKLFRASTRRRLTRTLTLDPALSGLQPGGWVAMQLVELPGPLPTLWLHSGADEPPAQLEGAVISGRTARAALDKHVPQILFRPDPNRPTAGAELPSFWEPPFDALRLGPAGALESLAETLPNMVYLGAENRYIEPLAPNDDRAEPFMEDAVRWLARYAPSSDKRLHLETSMTALRLANPARFQEIRERIQSVLTDIELLDHVQRETMRPLVRVRGEAVTTIDRLSSGERAAIISLFTVGRWLAPGGIVLIDEPELHQHAALVRLNLAALEDFVVNKMGGQLIVASHAPEVAEHFQATRLRTRLVVDLDRSEAAQSAAASAA